MKIPASMLIEEGALFPRRWGWPWGMAWRDRSMRAVVLPVPINMVAGSARWVYFKILGGIRPGEFERLRMAEKYWGGRLSLLYKERSDAQNLVRILSRRLQIQEDLNTTLIDKLNEQTQKRIDAATERIEKSELPQ